MSLPLYGRGMIIQVFPLTHGKHFLQRIIIRYYVAIWQVTMHFLSEMIISIYLLYIALSNYINRQDTI